MENKNQIRNKLQSIDKQLCLVQGIMGKYINILRETNPDLAHKMQEQISSLDISIVASNDLQEILGIAQWIK